MNILVFGQSFLGKIGGVQQSYSWLYEYLHARGHKITHVTHLPIPDSGLHYPFPPEVEIRGINLLFGDQVKKKIVNIANEVNPDVILVVNSGIRALVFCEALQNTPYPVVLSERGSPEYCISQLWRSRRLHELVIGSVEFFHMLMPSYVDFLPQDLRGRARVISSLTMPSPTRARPGQADGAGEYTLLYTGRFSEEKRLPLLVRAFGILAPQYPNWKLKLVGSGNQDEILKIAESCGVASKLELPGFAADPAELAGHYDTSHIYCLPSSFEGCPLALREAMAHALPVVGFASCPGTNEIIKDGVNGFLASGNTPETLAAALSKLMADPSLRVTLGSQGRKDVEAYAPEKTHAAWENMLVEASMWKGKKKRLRIKRFLHYPLKTIWRMLQPLPNDGMRRRDVFAPNLLSWFKQIRKHIFDFSLLNYFNVTNKTARLSSPQIMAYETRYKISLEKEDSEEENKRIARNMCAIAMRHGIPLGNLYHTQHKPINDAASKLD